MKDTYGLDVLVRVPVLVSLQTQSHAALWFPFPSPPLALSQSRPSPFFLPLSYVVAVSSLFEFSMLMASSDPCSPSRRAFQPAPPVRGKSVEQSPHS
jgi:hypothetical protein